MLIWITTNCSITTDCSIITNCLIVTNCWTINFSIKYCSQINWTNFFLSIASNNFFYKIVLIFLLLFIYILVWFLKQIYTIFNHSQIIKFDKFHRSMSKKTRNRRSFSLTLSNRKNFMMRLMQKKSIKKRFQSNKMNKLSKSNSESKCRDWIFETIIEIEIWNKMSKSLRSMLKQID